MMIQRQHIRVKVSTIGKPTPPAPIRIRPVKINRPHAPNVVKLNNKGRATINLAKLK